MVPEAQTVREKKAEPVVPILTEVPALKVVQAQRMIQIFLM